VRIVAIVRDWSRRDAATREGYPKAPVTVIELPLWSYADRDIYITNRLTLHNDAFFAMHTGHGMPECSADEMWEKPTMYAVMKEGGKRAKSVHTNKAEAEVAMPSSGYFLEVREGDRTRCSGFCQVSSQCDQYQKYLLTKE
jgi:hypothetical protein